MKRIGHIFSAACIVVASVSLFSCAKEDLEEDGGQNEDGKDETEAVLTVSEKDVTAENAGGDYFITVTAVGSVDVNISEDWLSAGFVIGQEEENFRIRVEPNNGRDERTASVTLSVEGCDDAVVSVVQEGQKSNTCDLLSFSLPGEINGLGKDIEFEYDRSSSGFSAMYLKWIEGENPEMMVPVFETDGARVLVNGSEIVSGETEISFADDFIVTVEAENGDTKDYTVSLNCPQINRELAVLHFKPSSEIVGKEEYVDTEIELYDKTPGSTEEGWWDSAEKGTVEMRGRGNSTWGLPKKPFRIKFPEKFSPVGLDHTAKKSWTLLAQDMDKSLIRTHIAFEYSRVLYNASEGWHDPSAVLFTPASKYVNVYITGWYTDVSTGERKYMEGDYLGVYQMSDQVEQGSGRIDVEDLDDKDGADPDKITGGYVIETDIHEGNHYSALKNIKMSYKYPKDDECDPAQYEYITDFINQAESVLYSDNFTDPENGWRRYFDEKTLIDFIIVKELAGDLDGYTSTYMYKRRGVDKLFFGPIWDCDKGWNNDRRVPHPGVEPLENLMIFAGFYMPSYVEDDWFQRLWEDGTFREAVASRWASKKAELLAVTDRVLNEMPAAMEKAIEANFTVWPFYYQYSDEVNMPAKDYPSEIERIRQLTEQRAALLDRLFK